MSGLGEFDYGEFLGIGLDNRQLAHLAGALFLGLFALSALRHASRASSFYPAIWLTIALVLLGCGSSVAGRGFPEHVPDFLQSWLDPDRLARLLAALALLAFSLVLLSAHWVRGSLSKFAYRLLGIAMAGTAIWLASGWFAEEIPEEARPWTTQQILIRAIVILGLLALAVAFWVRGDWSSAHRRWGNRALVPLVIASAVLLAFRWFVSPAWSEFPVIVADRVTVILSAIATGTCLLIAAGAYFLRDEIPKPKPTSVPFPQKPIAAEESPSPRLPIAVLIDENGRPVLPKNAG